MRAEIQQVRAETEACVRRAKGPSLDSYAADIRLALSFASDWSGSVQAAAQRACCLLQRLAIADVERSYPGVADVPTVPQRGLFLPVTAAIGVLCASR